VKPPEHDADPEAMEKAVVAKVRSTAVVASKTTINKQDTGLERKLIMAKMECF